jgi:glycosyltransferase involved in cell wall biosynthesis
VRFAELVPRVGSNRALERSAEQLAEGLVRLGVDTDVIRAPPTLGARARRLPDPRYDLVDVHGLEALRAFARAPILTRRLVFTPHQPQAGPAVWRRLARRPFSSSAGALVALAHAVICTSAGEARLVTRVAPPVVDRIHLVPEGVDFAGVHRAPPIRTADSVVLAMGCRGSGDQVECLVAALAGLEDRYQLVVLGRHAGGRSLNSLAAELGVSARMHFAGVVSAEERYRWIKAARVVVALSDAAVFDAALLEAVCAHAPIIASDTVAHREMAEYAPWGCVQFMSIPSSPLSLADAIIHAEPARGFEAPLGLPSSVTRPARVLSVYRALLERPRAVRLQAPERSAPPKVNGRFTRLEQHSGPSQLQTR